jgi:hypothetical protein
VRAVQRWEHGLGLPVHRIRTPDGQTVYAFREEIDRWRQQVDLRRETDSSIDETVPAEAPRDGHPTASPGAPLDNLDQPQSRLPPAVVAHNLGGLLRGRLRHVVWILAAVIGALVFGISIRSLLIRQPAGNLSNYRWNGKDLSAVDARGAVLWSYRFREEVGEVSDVSHEMPAVDLDGDGTVELLAMRSTLFRLTAAFFGVWCPTSCFTAGLSRSGPPGRCVR